MSVETLAPPVGVPQFSDERIGIVIAAAQTAPDDFRHEQLQTMSKFNNPLRAFFEAKIAAFGSRGESILCDRWMVGYTLAHSVLRSAVPDEARLPNRDTFALHGFALYIHRDPLVLDKVIEEDYQAHPGVLDFLNKLGLINDANTDGARFLLGSYSRWANPTRPARVLPRVHESALPTGFKDSRRRDVFAPTRFGSM